MITLLNGNEANHRWKVHTPNLLKEILNNNPGMSIMSQPIQIFANILYEVGRRAVELQDPEMIALCARLTLFEEADPESKEYNKEKVDSLMDQVYGKFAKG